MPSGTPPEESMSTRGKSVPEVAPRVVEPSGTPGGDLPRMKDMRPMRPTPMRPPREIDEKEEEEKEEVPSM